MIALARRVFPTQISNAYPGHRTGLLLFALVILLKIIIGMNSVINTRAVAAGADGLVFDQVNATAARTMVLMFATLGISQLLMGLFGLIALVRYRGLVPLICLLLLTEQFGRKFLAASGNQSLGPPSLGSYLHLIILVLLVAGFMLSVLPKQRPAEIHNGEKHHQDPRKE
jgi:hypothetical protein